MDLNLSRAKFNELTADLVEKTMGPVRQALSDSGLSIDKIDKVLMVGGSSRIPAVQEAVKKFTGKEPFKGINPTSAWPSAPLSRVPRCPARRRAW